MAADDPYSLKDSGARQEFETGSKRDTRDGKGRFDLLPTLPLQRMALLYEAGAKKYGDRNWEKGQPLSRYLDSAMRHLVSWMAGDRSEEHLIQCSWNCWAYVATAAWIAEGRLPKELDDISSMPPEMLAALQRGAAAAHHRMVDHGLRGPDGQFHTVDEHDAGRVAPPPGMPNA